jgi:hypothetical protein
LPKAIRTAIRKVFGHLGVVQRCQLHKQRNVLGHLPEHLHASARAVLAEALTRLAFSWKS